MKDFVKENWKGLLIALLLIAGLFYSAYEHRNEPHWMETHYVKIIK